MQIGLYIMAVLYVLAGLNHFRALRVYRPMMPPWLPWHDFLIYLSGGIEVLLGLALLWSPTQFLAAWAVIAMLIAFLPVHIYMYQTRNTIFQKIPLWIILVRLPMQLALIYWASLYTY